MLKRAVLNLLIAASCWVGIAAAQNQPLTIEDFYRPPAHGAVSVSRDGRHLATTVPSSTGRLNVAIVDLQTRKGNIITSFRDYDVLSLTWVGNDRLVFGIGQLNTPADEQRGGGLFSIDREGREVRTLTEPIAALISRGQNVWRRYSILRTIPGNDEEVLAEGNFRDADGLDVYRLNIRTGRSQLLTNTRPPRTNDWILDNDRVPRVAAVDIKDTNTIIVWYRKNRRWAVRGVVPLRQHQARHPVSAPLRGGQQNSAGCHKHQSDERGDPPLRPRGSKIGDLVFEHPRFDVGANQRFQAAGRRYHRSR
jgi:hypothetical protein